MKVGKRKIQPMRLRAGCGAYATIKSDCSLWSWARRRHSAFDGGVNQQGLAVEKIAQHFKATPLCGVLLVGESESLLRKRKSVQITYVRRAFTGFARSNRKQLQYGRKIYVTLFTKAVQEKGGKRESTSSTLVFDSFG